MKTLVIIKPDATVRNLFEQIITRLLSFPDIHISYLKSYDFLPHPLLREHYKEHEGKPFYDKLIWSMNLGLSFVLVLEGPNAVRRVRELIGATDPQKAAKGTIRGDLRCPESTGPYNLVHASDSWQAAIREMIIWGVVKPEEEKAGLEEIDADPDLALQPIKPWPQEGTRPREGHPHSDQNREGD